MAAAKKGGSRGAFPIRSPAWTIHCQRARGRDAARRSLRASFPRPPPIRRGLCVLQRPLRAAFPGPRAVRRRRRAPRAPPREARGGNREAFPRLRPSRSAFPGPFPRVSADREIRGAVRNGGNAPLARRSTALARDCIMYIADREPRIRGNASRTPGNGATPGFPMPFRGVNVARNPGKGPRNPHRFAFYPLTDRPEVSREG